MKVTDEDMFAAIRRELVKARAKFPETQLATIALMEEVGELAQAQLYCKAGRCAESNIINEAVQVAAMAIRIAVEGDESVWASTYVDN